jgi:hypothetical protein
MIEPSTILLLIAGTVAVIVVVLTLLAIPE